MARLGRKALKSLQRPGVQKLAVASIAGEMEAEVTPCKYGPFEPRANPAAAPPLTRMTEVSGNALRLLSDAAATHSTTGPNTGNPLQHITPASMILSMPSSSGIRNGETQAQAQTQAQTQTPASMNTTTTATATTATLPPTPHNNHLFVGPDAVSGPMDIGGGVGVYNHFNDLDNLFDGFFDLSMPTIFQDPLFDGEAFVNAGIDFSTGSLMDDGGQLYPDLGLNGSGRGY